MKHPAQGAAARPVRKKLPKTNKKERLVLRLQRPSPCPGLQLLLHRLDAIVRWRWLSSHSRGTTRRPSLPHRIIDGPVSLPRPLKNQGLPAFANPETWKDNFAPSRGHERIPGSG